MSDRPPLSRQISALQAEILVRRKELDEEVRRGRVKDSQRTFILQSLEAAVDTLKWLQAIEPTLKQRLWNNDQAPAGGCW
ncbi:hypothetical protein [Hansschlegelia zhihuaiae]|uniref:Uncharacterized protein n=1 Tax=Hansschlegelia zhihuaiae TaxID=405005 RepID=A0A4Q0MMQ0_9HYPH|nr:hypothetical protein [Hansschlegelia zhihuaiae]RXF75040.1 hypothetical protein EK403_03045 [Hansschlegelia zhihuaiae]